MKKYLGLSTILFIVLAMAFVININATRAEDNASSNISTGTKIKTQADLKKTIEISEREKVKKQIEVAREEAKQKMEILKEKIKEEKNTAKAKIKETRITGRENALKRFDVAVERITGLKDKIVARISALELKEIDVTSAESFIATVETKLNATKAKIIEANVLLATSINELTLENKTKLRTLTQEIQTLLRETHDALKDSVKALREAIKVKMEAKTKVETSPTTETNQ
ncbi:MAG: hypothetical protein AAB595_00295 [Patescibacteria group bacterium]